MPAAVATRPRPEIRTPGGPRRPRQHGRRSRFRSSKRFLLALLIVFVGWAGWSYMRALTAPGNDPVGIRTTEWFKDHYFGWAVNDVERFWYTHHQPKKGGAPTGALGSELQPGSQPTATAPPEVRHLPAPAPIAPLVSDPMAGEGQWKPLGATVRGVPAMYAAFLRPDTVHTSLVTAVAWMDPTLVRLVGYAGVVEPGGGPWPHQAPIAQSARPDLLAAFNSGFKMRDSRGGYYSDGRMLRPLQNGAATLVIRSDGSPDIGQWGRDLQLTPDVVFARQNIVLIVDQGAPVPGIGADNVKWGATLGNAVLVWRSGIGITASGALVYAAGNGLSAASLAGVLARAGAVRAMELDINSTWVDFFTYAPGTTGLTVTKLLPDMRPSTSNYLTASSRDFIAVFRRAS
jgi:hypothetical protein